MIANIISRYSFILTDTLNTSGYTFKFDSDYDGKSQITFYRKPKAEEDDFILVMDGKDIAFQGIISKIENESNSDAYKVTAVEMQTLFNQKVILTDESIKTETGIEDFIADQIRKNFIESDDALVNIGYLTVTANTHTPIATAVSAEDGIYNLKSYIANAMTMYGVFVEFEFTSEALNVVIEKKEQSEFKIDATLPEVQNLTEVIDYQPMTKLTVLWNSATYQFFMKTDGTITTDMEDEDRAKGSSDIIVSTAETEAAMIQEAHDAFTSNSYNHKITFDVSPDSKMIPSKEVIEVEEDDSILPEGYRQLTYIESTGTQYIDTGFIPNQDTRIMTTGKLLSHSANASIFGARKTASSATFTMTWVDSNNNFLSYYGAGYTTIPFTENADFVIDKNKNVTTINGTVYNDEYEDFTCPASLFIFATNNNGSLLHYGKLRMKEMQIYDNDALVRDFIPCRNPSGDVGLYDLVTAQFFGNAGTGAFLQGEAVVSLPEGFERAHYVESTGTQYIDTGYKPNQDSGIKMDFALTGNAATEWLFCGRTAASDSAFGLYAYGTGDAFYYVYGTEQKSIASLGRLSRRSVSMKGSQVEIDGETHTFSEQTFTSAANLCLLARNTNGTIASFASAKLYSCQIYDNGTLVRDYIPCKDSTGVFGLYDLVEGKFYGNAGTGSFLGTVKRKLPEGYTQVDYIESSGSQYVDTGLTVTTGTRIVCDFQMTSTPSTTTVLFRVHSSPFGFGFFSSGYFRTWGGSVYSFDSSISATDRHYVDKSATQIILDDITVSTTAHSASTETLPLFAGNNNGSITQCISAKLYSCQIYDDGTLVRDYVPCTNSSGTVGLYDMVNNAFYTNVGSGTFTTGEEIAFVENVGVEGVVVTKTVNTLYVGKVCTVKTKNGIRTSIITAMELNSESSMISLIFGKLKVTLIEKLKGVEAKT